MIERRTGEDERIENGGLDGDLDAGLVRRIFAIWAPVEEWTNTVEPMRTKSIGSTWGRSSAMKPTWQISASSRIWCTLSAS